MVSFYEQIKKYNLVYDVTFGIHKSSVQNLFKKSFTYLDLLNHSLSPSAITRKLEI